MVCLEYQDHVTLLSIKHEEHPCKTSTAWIYLRKNKWIKTICSVLFQLHIVI